jgi:hypothetical protein
MSTDNGTAYITATVPRQTRAAHPNAIRKSGRFGERNGTYDHHKHHPQIKTPGRTRRMQEINWVFQTLEFRFRKILKISGIVVWEQVLESWHQLDDRNLEPLFLYNGERRIYERLEVWCDYNILGSRLMNKVDDKRSRILGRNRESGTFSADDPELDGSICDCV